MAIDEERANGIFPFNEQMRKERAKEHQCRLEHDPNYKEDFLKATRIPNASNALAKQIYDLYALHNCEDNLPGISELAEIINNAHKDTQESERARITGEYGGIGCGRANPKINGDGYIKDYGYYILEELTTQYLYEIERSSMPPMPEEEARMEVEKVSRWTRFITPIVLCGVTAAGSLNPLKGFLYSPISLTLGIINALTPKSKLIKECMEGEKYEETQGGKEDFKNIKSRIDEVIIYYQGKSKWQ